MTEMAVQWEGVYRHSKEIVAREIEGELIIVPLVSGISETDDELFTLNETGRAIWALLDGKNNLTQIVQILTERYEGGAETIEQDVHGLVLELLTRRMIKQVPTAKG